jgi:hypothetical protein
MMGVELRPNITGKRNMLLILDNCDVLIKQSVNAFVLLIKYYLEQCNVSIMFTSQVEIVSRDL